MSLSHPIGKTSQKNSSHDELLKNGLFKLMASRTCLRKQWSCLMLRWICNSRCPVSFFFEAWPRRHDSVFWRLLKRYTFQKCLLSGFGFGKKYKKRHSDQWFIYVHLCSFRSTTCLKLLEKSVSSLLQRFRKLQHGIPRMDLAYFHGCFRFLHPSKTPTKESAEFSDSHIWPQVAICHWDYSISNIFIVFLNFASILNTFFHLRLLYNQNHLVTFFRKFPPV